MTGDGDDRDRSVAEEDGDVTALLRAAAGPLPTPDPVAERLDGVLAELVAERETDRVLRVDPARLRRRRWSQALVAAAAVLVAGYAVWAGPLTGSSGGSSSSDTTTAGGSVSTRPSELTGRSTPESLGAPRAALPEVRPEHLRADLRRALGAPAVAARPGPSGDGTVRCPAVRAPASGETLTVRYGGRTAVAVTGAGSGRRVPVTLYACDGRVLARTSLAPAALSHRPRG